jgi:transposase
MAKRGVRKKDYEKLDDLSISKVIVLLEQDKPITKKAACEFLNISYSTVRLAKIIQEYKDKIEYAKKRFKQNKGLPFSELEKREIIIEYLKGISIDKISKALFRSPHSIKKFIKDLHLPERSKNATYNNPDLIPDEILSEDYSPGEFAWSARYNCVVEVRKNLETTNKIYLIYVFGKHMQFAYQPWYELGKLEILKQYNLTEETFQTGERPNFQYRID